MRREDMLTFYSAAGISGSFAWHTIGICILLCGCTTTHQPDIVDQCDLYPVVEWTRLATPPPEARQMLAAMNGELSHTAEGKLRFQEAWFRAENSKFRYCRYGRAKDPCKGIPEIIDFQFYYGKWNIVGGGLQEICLDGPDRVTRSSRLHD
jgi:hypothetical protein